MREQHEDSIARLASFPQGVLASLGAHGHESMGQACPERGIVTPGRDPVAIQERGVRRTRS
jgi:hypothetical protein